MKKMGTRVGGIVVISLAFLAKISISKSFSKVDEIVFFYVTIKRYLFKASQLVRSQEIVPSNYRYPIDCKCCVLPTGISFNFVKNILG